MLIQDKMRGAMDAPHSMVDRTDDSIWLAALQELREEALCQAIKYRYDPALGRAHTAYLNKLNLILQGK
jgi:hypothetical protein